MEQLLENLIAKSKLEAEECHRAIVHSLNGLAAILIIKEEWKTAVETYREVLRSVEEHKNIKTDSLQRLHSIYNLAELLEAKHTDIEPTLRDASLREEVDEIKTKYLKQYPAKVKEVDTECQEITEQIKTLENKYQLHVEWWIAALESTDKDFVAEVRDELLSKYSRFQESKCLLYPVHSRVHLLQVLKAQSKTMKSQRNDMIKGIKNLLKEDPKSFLDGAIDCHLRPTEKDPPQCILCATHEFFNDYEETLFSMKEIKHLRTTGVSLVTQDVKDKAQVLENTRKGNWGQSETEKTLKYLQTKSLGKVTGDVYDDSQVHLQVLNTMKKEFKNYRILWRAIYDHVSALDEVNMATLRLRLRYPDEELPDLSKSKKKTDKELDSVDTVEAPTYILEESELPQQELKFNSEKILHKNQLRRKLGQLLYLQNLQKADYGKRGGCNPEPCPICQNKLGEKWAVFHCGHSYCIDCLKVLSTRNACNQDRGSLKCPVCRQPTRMSEVSYIDTQAREEEEIKVQGSLSTKMEGVIRTVMKIKESDPDAKVLIFSSWFDVLEIIGDSLEQNGITYRSLNLHNKFQTNLTSFKTKKEITVLLMLINSGSNGLNITTANHVILVEPILNPASELQAIGRIHRIGQTRPTVVHRLLVRDTIEERMFNIINSGKTDNESDAKAQDVTINDLRKLFICSEELELEERIEQASSSSSSSTMTNTNNESTNSTENSGENAIDEDTTVEFFRSEPVLESNSVSNDNESQENMEVEDQSADEA